MEEERVGKAADERPRQGLYFGSMGGRFVSGSVRLGWMGFPLLVVCCAMRGQGGTPVTADEANAAVGLVTKLYTINSLAKADAKGKPLPKTGSWGVRPAVSGERVAACELEGATCDEVVYRAGQPEVVCSWTVLFAGAGAPPQIVSDNDGSAMYMLRRFSKDDKDRPADQKHDPPEMPPIAAIAHSSGRVLLKIVVDPGGKVIGVEVLDSSNHMFDMSAIQAVKKWQMTPYTLNGRPRAYQQDVLMNFM
jgi:TonB family protein